MVRRIASRSLFGLALAALLASPRVTSAQLYTWDYMCAVGSITACGSFSLTLQYDALAQPYGAALVPEGVTRATLSFRNLQGMSGVPAAPAWQITDVGLSGLRTNWTTAVGFGGNYSFWGDLCGAPAVSNSWGYASISADRPVQFVGRGTMCPEASARRGASLSNGLYEGSFSWFTPQPLAGGGLYGCDQPQGTGWNGGLWGGCGTTLSLGLTLPGKWSMAASTSLSWRGKFDSSLQGCTIGVDCVAVPEPSTYLLMLTGIMGLGFAARRRREALDLQGPSDRVRT